MTKAPSAKQTTVLIALSEGAASVKTLAAKLSYTESQVRGAIDTLRGTSNGVTPKGVKTWPKWPIYCRDGHFGLEGKGLEDAVKFAKAMKG